MSLSLKPSIPALMPAPKPALEPLQLLYVTNGSPLTADRWWLAHHYYQHRQNLHYQSLHQPGIVRGLGVRVVDAPDMVSAVLRDSRWIEIQPGLAIDLVGNPIVLEQPTTFRVTAKAIDHPVTTYIVLAYVNPREKQWADAPADVVKEEFRISERTTPPAADEVELCRIEIADNQAPLQDAISVLHPLQHQLDLQHRQSVQVRSPHPVQVGVLIQSEPGQHLEHSFYLERLDSLVRAVDGLCPALAGATSARIIPSAQISELPELASALTVLFLPYDFAIALSANETEPLQQYVARGGTLVVEFAPEERDSGKGACLGLGKLLAVKAELTSALKDIDKVNATDELARVRQDLTEELDECQAACQSQLQAIAAPLQQFTRSRSVAQAEEGPLDPVFASPLPVHHPFSFDSLPHLPTGPIQLVAWDGVVLAVGALSAGWTAGQFEQPLDRETLRSAQELGINILYQASRRQNMIQAQQPHLFEEASR